jgi:hypothetical protein
MPVKSARQIVFVKSGSFSGTNVYVESILRKYFPGFDIRVIDVNKLLRGHPATLLTIALTIFLCKPTAFFDRHGTLRENFFFHLWRSPGTFKAISGLVRRTIRKHYPEAAFILQTQSMWDSAT